MSASSGPARFFAASCAIACLCWAAVPSIAQEAAANPEARRQQAPQLTVAILDFQANLPGNPELGAQVSETLTAVLSGTPGLTLVDRPVLARALQEQELNLSGLVAGAQATKVGNLVGAKLLVTGKVFAIDKQLLITAKIIGTETSLVEGLVVKGDQDADVGKLVLQLGESLAERLPKVGPKLVAAEDTAIDPLPELKKRLATLRLPRVSVKIPERHVQVERAARVDPAVETEIKRLLIDCGFTVIDGDARDQAKAGVEVTVTGEAFTEFAARIGNLVSCTDRVEVQVTRVADGKVLLADRDNNRSVDLSENLAAKRALQKSGRLLAIRILKHFAQTLPKQGPAAKAE